MILRLILISLFSVGSSAQDVTVMVPASGSVTFTSPNHPNEYPNNANVVYTVIGPTGFGIQFDAEEFSVEGGTCKFDYVSFSEFVNGTSVPISGPLCGTDGPSRLKSTTNIVTVLFVSDDSFTSTGFKVSAQVSNCPVGKDSCPGDKTSCLSISQYCDGVKDCPGGTDENCNAGCGKPAIPPSVLRFNNFIQELKSQKTSPRIVGGTEATPHSWPWQVALLWTSGALFCGGSIIDNEWILTAAHCCTESILEDYRVRIGAHNLASRSEVNAKTLQLARLVLHPDYEPSTFHQDLCLLKTVEPIIFNAEVSPVCLADALDGPVGQKCWVTGWGGTVQENYTFSNNAPNVQTRPPSSLRQVDVVILERSKCPEDATITPEMFCAQAPGKDSCQGDSGGALVCQDDSGIFKQVGVVSSGSGCADPGFPGIYGKTFTALEWIASTIYSSGEQ